MKDHWDTPHDSVLDLAKVREVVKVALAEDVGPGDVTTAWTVPSEHRTCARIVAKADGAIAGLDVARLVFEEVDRTMVFSLRVEDGDQVHVGEVIAEMEGRASGILTGERTALNFLQRLSGIATLTQRYVQAVRGTGAKIIDTRKTTPGLRALEKYAVRCGGGANHRFGLYDMVLIKENHSAAAGGIAQAVQRANACRRQQAGLKIEVETRNIVEVREALRVGVDRIMLDNMDLKTMKEAVELIQRWGAGSKRVEVEASGGVTLENVRKIAETGVDLISVGALTHSAGVLDMSLLVGQT